MTYIMLKRSQSNARTPDEWIAAASTPYLAEPAAKMSEVVSAWMYRIFSEKTACSSVCTTTRVYSLYWMMALM